MCRRGDFKHLEDSDLNAGSVCGRASMKGEVTIPGHDGILKGDGGRIDRTLPDFDSKMLMCVVPGARGTCTCLSVVGSWRDRIMLWRPGGWQQRASSLMMRALLKSVVAHRWYVC